MSETLTFGQMVDQLKVGEVAEGTFGEIKTFVTKSKLGSIYTCNRDGDFFKFPYLKASSESLASEWRILPRYVSFEEAMKALREDENKLVFLYLTDDQWLEISSTTYLEITFQVDLTFSDLLHGKWVIEEGI